jgi:hypothetical protein
MTTKTTSKLLTLIIPRLPEFKIKGGLLCLPITNGIFSGCNFDSSDFDKNVVLITYFTTVVAFPLEFLGFDMADRLRDQRGGDRWDLSASDCAIKITDAIKQQAFPALSARTDPSVFARVIRKTDTVQAQRAAAVALALAGEDEKALHLISTLIPKLDLSVPWESDIDRRLSELAKHLRAGTAKELLNSWEEISRDRLKLF